MIALALDLQTSAKQIPFETVLAPKLAHDRFESKALYHDLHAALAQFGLSLYWEKTYGPTPIKIGSLQPGHWRHSQLATLAVWREGNGTGIQVLDQCAMNLEDFDDCEPIGKSAPREDEETVLGSETYRNGDRLVMCGSGWGGGNFTLACARIYKLRGGHWDQVTGPGPDSDFELLPGTHFLRRHGVINPSIIIATLEISPDHLSQSAAGPNFLELETWRVWNRSIQIGLRHRVESPLVELDRLAAFSQNENWPAFARELRGSKLRRVDRKNLWDALNDTTSASCENSVESTFCPVLYITYDAHRDLKLNFKRARGRWKLRSLSYTKAQ